MSLIDQLAEGFARLPGIGPKTAQRLVFHLMKDSPDEARRLARAIKDVADHIRPCSRCGNFTEHDLCAVCADSRRDATVLCVVEEAYEVSTIEHTASYRGLYHVLGGRLSPLDGVGPEELRVAALLARVRDSNGAVREVIIATNTSVEGEATAVYLQGALRPLGPKVTRLAQGIPIGSDLEYVDGSTLAEALSGRREM